VDAGLRRPPKVEVICGAGAIPRFESVIESMRVTYASFADDGRPRRAAVGLRLREVHALVIGRA
jgi:hypothetical protein